MSLRPFISAFIIVGTLFLLVFVKMEVRRLGYTLLASSRQEKKILDMRREMQVSHARLVRPDRIENFAKTRLELQRAVKGQIVHMYGPQRSLVSFTQ